MNRKDHFVLYENGLFWSIWIIMKIKITKSFFYIFIHPILYSKTYALTLRNGLSDVLWIALAQPNLSFPNSLNLPPLFLNHISFFSVSLRYDTTMRYGVMWLIWLWIAFIFEYLWDMTQLIIRVYENTPSCELLSFLSIFEIWHNVIRFAVCCSVVVNCFHFWVSLRYDTTNLIF